MYHNIFDVELYWIHQHGWPSTQPGTCTQPCPIVHTAVPHCSHSRAPGEQWSRLCEFTLQGCVQAARLCRGSPVINRPHLWCSYNMPMPNKPNVSNISHQWCTWTREEDNWKCISIIGLLRYSIYIELPSQSPEHLYADNPNWSQIWVSVPRTNNWLCVCEHVIPLTNVAHYSRTKWTR